MINEDDLSNGSAACKIPLVNVVDDEKFLERYIYIAANVEEDGFVQKNLKGCNCIDRCLPSRCPCMKSSTIRITNDRRIDLSKKKFDFYKDILYECSSQTCKGCAGNCGWKLTPKDFDLEVEVFKTAGAGWAVRSRQFIETGSFVGEFVGEVVGYAQMEKRPHDYAYDLPLLSQLNQSSNIFVDPRAYGNVTRFFNHSCFANLKPFRYFSHHRDKSRISLGFFASHDIIPGDELTIDYGPEWWRGKIEEAREKGENFYCCCSWLHCINPAPGKLQLDKENALKEMGRRILLNHNILMLWKENEARRLEKEKLKVETKNQDSIDNELEK